MSGLRGGETYRIFHSSLTIAGNRMNSDDFIRGTRCWATLPQGHTHDDASIPQGADYVTDWCRVDHQHSCKHGILLDVNGNHCVLCKNTTGACIRMHNEHRNAFAALGRITLFDAVKR